MLDTVQSYQTCNSVVFASFTHSLDTCAWGCCAMQSPPRESRPPAMQHAAINRLGIWVPVQPPMALPHQKPLCRESGVFDMCPQAGPHKSGQLDVLLEGCSSQSQRSGFMSTPRSYMSATTREQGALCSLWQHWTGWHAPATGHVYESYGNQ